MIIGYNKVSWATNLQNIRRYLSPINDTNWLLINRGPNLPPLGHIWDNFGLEEREY